LVVAVVVAVPGAVATAPLVAVHAEQAGLRVVVDRWGVGEPHLDTVAGQFIEHDDLIGIIAGEPVRRQAPLGFPS
jgi:hypothetical protein